MIADRREGTDPGHVTRALGFFRLAMRRHRANVLARRERIRRLANAGRLDELAAELIERAPAAESGCGTGDGLTARGTRASSIPGTTGECAAVITAG